MTIIMRDYAKGWFPSPGEVCECLSNSRQDEDSEPVYRRVSVIGYDKIMEQVLYIPIGGRWAGLVCKAHQQADYFGDMQFRKIQQ